MNTTAPADIHPSDAPPTLRVALVNMPFGSTRRPSIQLGLLQAILKGRGFACDSHYFNLRFASRIGWEAYEALCDEPSYLIGEWLFSRAAFAEGSPEPETFIDAYRPNLESLCARLGCDIDFLTDVRERHAPAFIQECLDTVPWDDYDVVGFGSVFEQNCAALALARLIKERHPHIVTVFGGANFEDEMGLEYVRALPWIDYAVLGEGDEVFPALLARLAAREEIVSLPGVARRGPDGVVFDGRAPQVRDLDALPQPDYDDFFALAKQVQLPAMAGGFHVQLPYESARGCWWGDRHHCTFCGLNALGMAFRSQSPARVLDGINQLARRYHVYSFMAVDNIMDHRYIKDVFVPLAEQRRDYDFFYEVKANLKQEQIRDMARGGVRYVQPGIESLSTHVLQLMRKGTTAIQNVRLMKWAKYYGITISWNILLGFPGERPEDYEAQLATVKLIPHLQPPVAPVHVRLDRFSPFYEEAESLGMANLRASRAYACVYPGQLDLDRIAYYFDYEAPDTLPRAFHTPLKEQVRWWKEAWQSPRRPYLTAVRGEGRLTVMDGRLPEAPRVHVFDETAALVYEFCSSTYHRAGKILTHLRDERGIDIDTESLQTILDDFAERGLLMEENRHYLSLALPNNRNW
jgi:ribosomal peptide maturation radical SAM protein 1